MSKHFSSSRRQFVKSAAFMASGLVLNGCVRRIPANLPPTDLTTPLTVDIHCHFFNGTDLQMQRFLQYVHDANGDHPVEAAAAPLAQEINWGVAPTGKSEMKKLRPSDTNEAKAHEKQAKAHASEDGKFRKQLSKHRTDTNRITDRTTQNMSPSSESAKKCSQHAEGSALAGGTLSAFNEYFQYRYVALSDYLNIYTRAGNRTMDLMIAHLVDYDWPLNNGSPTRTHLNDQVKLMERISVLSKGRVHTFVPFDPFREIAYKAKIRGATWSALDAVKHWVASYGCIGVKIYPPMGFVPYGNTSINLDSWRKRWDWLPNVENVPDGKGGHATIGERLDDVLGELYCWCLDNDLPVMAHTSLSNGLRGFDEFSAATHWASLRNQFGNLRVNFGHLGGLEGTSEQDWTTAPNAPLTDVNARDLVALMASNPSAPGGQFFADSAYTEKVLSDRQALLNLYKRALSWKAAEQDRPILQDRLMYGSDWSLVMQENDMQSYFADFVWMYSQLDAAMPSNGATMSDKFFGDNAVNYLGLRDGQTRQRLTDFYSSRRVTFDRSDKPGWMNKVRG